MNRNLLTAGGVVLIAGGLAYWYLSQNGGGGGNGGSKTCWKCEGTIPVSKSFPTSTTCGQGNAIYYPYSKRPDCTGPTPCELGINLDCGPDGIWEGLKRCDGYMNLCQCNNGKWVCIEEKSQLCIDGIQHLDCFKNQEEDAVCYYTSETGEDECEYPSTSYGCPCSQNIACMPGSYCCDDNICQPGANNTNISADENDIDWKCYTHGGWNSCSYSLDRPYKTQLIHGKYKYKWGPWPVTSWGDYEIIGLYKGERVVKMSSGGTNMWETGTLDINQTMFTPTCIDGIELNITCAFAGDIRPTGFIGNIGY